MCTGTIEPGKLMECPWASKYMRPEDMPTFVGGTCECEGGCVGDVPNDCSTVCGIDLVAQEEEEWEEEEGDENEEGGGGGGGWFGGWFG